MVRRSRSEAVQSEAGLHSGVFRAVTPERMEQLERDLRAASARLDALRGDIATRAGTLSEGSGYELTWKALQEIDTAHEELRVAQEELTAQSDALLSAHTRVELERRLYGELFEAAPEAYFVTDAHGAILKANRCAASLFNLGPEMVVGNPLVSLVAHDDRVIFFDLLEAMSQTVFHTELRIRPRNERQTLWVALSAQHGFHGDGALCILWLMRNITAEKEERLRHEAADARLRARIRELEAAQASPGIALAPANARQATAERRREIDILAEVAHELRGPLGTIAGWLHMLGDGPVDAATIKRALTSMTRGVRGLARIVDDLLEHARAENHQVTLKTSTINLVGIAIEVVEDMRPLTKLKQIRLELATKSHKVEVQADAWRLRQVFRNLIGNAIKFTPERGSVRITIAIENFQAEVAIADTGRGIPPESLERIFQPFVQIAAPGTRHTGLGLGLSIAQRLVGLHGGSIRAESDGPHRGATFRVRLPLFAPN